MATPLSVSIVHPAYSNLKKYSALLHFFAGLVFLTVAYYEYKSGNSITAFCELVIGLDVMTIAFIKRFSEESTRLNATFRLIEVIVFGGLSILALFDSSWLNASLLLLTTAMYYYVFHFELKIIQKESVSVHHLGVTISGFPKDKEIEWEQIKDLKALPHSISIQTQKQKNIHFEFQKAIAFEELEQIHEFCMQYLKQVDRR